MTRMLATLASTLALLSLTHLSVASAEHPLAEGQTLEAATQKQTTKWVRLPNEDAPAPDGEHLYIVQFDDEALPLYSGGISGLAATNMRSSGRLNPKSPAARAYVYHLQRTQTNMLANMSAEIGSVSVQRSYQHALNAVTVRMTDAAASKVRRMQGVRFVERDRAVELSTATSPSFIGADQVWNGSATGGMEYLGEGMVVGIIDSGINHEHPSFADIGGDLYDHTNPLGAGNYLGECSTFAGLCNDKLIGAYTFLDAQGSVPPDEILVPGDAPSSDTDGHGTHVASTAAGNVLLNVVLPDADGNPSSVVFDEISGVAPHANVVAFKVCAPSCFFSDIVAAVDQAIADGVVNALNHSIGSPGGNPWDSSQAQAFLAARAAGIFVSNSAGNSGPGAGTAEAAGNAPWVAGVAATTHDRSYPPKMLMNMSGGDTAAPADMTGRSVSGAFTGPIVYAGEFPIAGGGDNETQPEQCLEPFPAGTFTADQIVVCDRGAIARVAKGQHVRDGGAGGFILANIDGGATSTNNDTHVIPAIHINAADGNILRAWLASGAGHMGTITAVDTPISDPAAGDNVAGFSSRGPYTGFDILAPNTAAPGVEILAGGAELSQDQIDLIHALYIPDLWESVPGQFGQIGGTSMASPHITGTATLLKQANPGWTDAEVLSAIMTTGSYDLVKEDGVTPADSHDIGGGRVQVNVAVNAGLVLDESIANFEAANPDLGGDPATLNVAGMVRGECVGSCSWTRTVRATVGGTWNTAGLDPWVTVAPASFTLAAGETQDIEVTADASGLAAGAWSFNRAVLTPDDPTVPTSQLPIAVVPASGDLPDSVDLEASRDAGSQLITDVTALDLSDFNVKIYEPAKVEGDVYALPEDSDNSSAYDDLTDGVQVVIHDVPAGSQRAVFEVLASESPDLDLFVGVVLDPADPVNENFEVCVSATGTALESCDLDAEFLDLLRDILGTEDLTFYALIQNWAASGPGAVDEFVFATTNVSGDEAGGSLYAEGPAGALPALTPFDVRFFWNIPSVPGERYISTTEWYADGARSQLLGTAPLHFNRGENDTVFLTDALGPVNVGQTVNFGTFILPNFTNEDRTYMVKVEIPDGLEVDPASINEGGQFDGDSIEWMVTQESLLGQEGGYTISTPADNAFCDTGFGGYVNLADFGILPDPTFAGDTTFGTFFSGQNPIEFYGSPRSNGFTVSDDGFGFFDSTPGPSPWVNQFLPDPTEPNDLLAPLWSDWVINYDITGARIRGVTAATAGPDVSIIEWDGMEFFPGDGSNPIAADFEVVMFSAPDPDFPEFVFAYDNVDIDFIDLLQSIGFFTVGVENQDGTAGTEYGGTIRDGQIVCLDYDGPSSDPRPLLFQVTPQLSINGESVEVEEANTVDNPGSEEVSEEIEIDVLACVDNLHARPKGNKIQLTWTNTGDDSYNVYRSDDAGGPFALIANTTSTYSTYLDRDLPVRLGEDYFYVVRPVTDGLERCESNEAGATLQGRGRGRR